MVVNRTSEKGGYFSTDFFCVIFSRHVNEIAKISCTLSWYTTHDKNQLKSVLTSMIGMWIVHTRLFILCHIPLHLESEITDVLIDVIDVHLVIEELPSVFWFLTGETPQSFRYCIASMS